MDQETQQQPGTPAESPKGAAKQDYTKWIVIGGIVLVVLYGAQYFLSPHRMMERGIERAIEREVGGDVDIDYGRGRDGETNVTFSGEDGETYTVNTGADVALPDNWPASIPLPGDAKVTYTGTMMTGEPGGGTTVAFLTRQSPAEITEYYKKELVQNGWTIAATMATADGSMVSASREDNEGVILYVSTSPEGTAVSMTVTARN
jgi:hypothetical protein